MKKITSAIKASQQLQEWVLRILLYGAKTTPKTLSGRFCALIALLARPFSKKDRGKIERNIDKILGIPAGSEASRNFQERVLKHQIASSFESFKSSFNHDLIEVAGLDELQQKIRVNLERGRGLIITTGHLGSWELVAYYSSLATGEKFNALAKPSKLDAATRLLDEYRLRMNTKTLWTDQRSLLKTMVKTLQEGEALGFVMDQRPDGRKGPVVDFMGQPTQFAVGPAWTAIRNGSPVMGVFCMREAPWKYRLISSELLPADHGETDTVKVTQLMASEIERVIRRYPEQWVWNYTRWHFQ
jgi:KDO2-lipid IV(A) lauroyltransferase